VHIPNGQLDANTSPVGTVVKGTDSATVAVIDPNPPVPTDLFLPLIQR